MSYLQCIIISC